MRTLAARAGYGLTFRSDDRAAWCDASRIGFERADHGPMAALIGRSLAGAG